MISGTFRIKWKSISLGDHAYLSSSYTGNNDLRIVPRGKGIIVRSTDEMGGGYLTITVKGVVARSDRKTLEQYFLNADSSFNLTEPGDLTLDDDVTITDCYLESFDQDDDDHKANTFTFRFIKSL